MNPVLIQRMLAFVALAVFVLLQLFGAAWHQAAHAAEHEEAIGGLQLTMEDRVDGMHQHDHEAPGGDGHQGQHQLHHALHCATHMFEHIQLFDTALAARVTDNGTTAWIIATAPLSGGTVDPIVPPPNA